MNWISVKDKLPNGLFTSATDEWETPQDLFQKLDAEFHFNLDPCANDLNHKCARYFTKAENGLLQKWGGVAFFAILHMAGRLDCGWKRRIMRKTSQGRLL